MTFEVHLEDYYHALIPYVRWKDFSDKERIVPMTLVLLKTLDQYNVQATFYVLGHVVETHSSLISRIVEKGHRLGSHGYYHQHAEQEGDFSDLRTRQMLLHFTSPLPITAYRSPYWETTPRLSYSGGAFFRLLPLPIVKKELYRTGIFYIHPHDLDPETPRLPHAPWWRYLGLAKAQNRLEELLGSFSFRE